MVWCPYDEMAAAVDRAYAVAPDEPLPVRRMFAELVAAAKPEVGKTSMPMADPEP
jgi:hypothetical protein